jgi:hypothetical protein
VIGTHRLIEEGPSKHESDDASDSSVVPLITITGHCAVVTRVCFPVTAPGSRRMVSPVPAANVLSASYHAQYYNMTVGSPTKSRAT